VSIRGNKIFRTGVKVSEITATAAGDQYFFSNSIPALEQQNASVLLARFNGTDQASSASSKNNDVVF
jgi:hypothetical protein